MLNKNKIVVAAGLSLLTSLFTVSTWADTSQKALVKGHEYLAVTNYPDNLHLIDVATDKVYKTCNMPGQFGPGTVSISPDKKRAYVLGNGFRQVYGFDLDTCKLEFNAVFAQAANEDARAMFSFAVSADGKELYSVNNAVHKSIDHYTIQQPRLQVFSTDGGVNAKPVRSFPAPRQVYIMQAADDGSLYMAGPDIYKVNVQDGSYTVAIPSRNWKRENYGQPDVLYFWPHQQVNRDFSILYTAPKFTDASQNLETAEYKYGFFNVNLATGETETKDFGDVVEIYFTGQRSPKEPNLMYGLLNLLTKYDIEKQELLQAQELDHTYYNLHFSTNGDKIYLVGTLNDISIHDAQTLEKTGSISLPGGDMAITTAQVFIR